MTIIEEEEVEEEEEVTNRINQPPPITFINFGNNTGSTQQLRGTMSQSLGSSLPI